VFFVFIFADYPWFRLSGKMYFPTNPDNRESTVVVVSCGMGKKKKKKPGV
jgi:hypothetical protein